METRIEQVRSGFGAARLAVAALLIAAVLGFGARGVFAQDATPPADETTGATSTDEQTTSTEESAITEESEADAAYDAFVAALAANLGSDVATVEAALTQTMTDLVDEQLAAGEISANEAAARTERIANGEIPFRFGWLGGHDGRGGPGAGGDGMNGRSGGRDGRGERGGPGAPGAPGGAGFPEGPNAPADAESGDAPAGSPDDATGDESPAGVGGGTTDDVEPTGTPTSLTI